MPRFVCRRTPFPHDRCGHHGCPEHIHGDYGEQQSTGDTVMVLMGQSTHWWQAVPVFSPIAATAAASYYILAGANRVRGLFGEIGIRVLGRLMGLVLVAIAVQFVLNGLADVGMAAKSG